MNIYDGTYLWVWEPWNVLNGDINAMITKLHELGVTGVMLKYSDGSLAGDPVSQKFMDTFKQYAPQFKAAGFTIAGWTYQYLTDVDGEVDALRQAVEAGADWIVLDGEKDVAGKGNLVTQYGQKVRALYPDLKIGFSTYAIADYHPEIPFDAYNSFVDVMMPQIYWATMGFPVIQAFNASIASYRKYGKPIAPTGQSYDTATAADIASFVNLCSGCGFTHVSWWSWQSATEEQLQAIYGNLIQPPVPPTPKFLLAVNDANYIIDRWIKREFDLASDSDKISRHRLANELRIASGQDPVAE